MRCGDLWHQERNDESVHSWPGSGNHSYLAITMRVTLVRIFLKSFLTLHRYITFEKLLSYKIGYWVPSKLDYFRIKDCGIFCIHIYIYYIILDGYGGSSCIV